MKATLAGLESVDAVAHEAGTDVFVVQHRGPLNDAVHAVDRIVLVRWVRRELEKLGRLLKAPGTQ